MTDTPNPTNPAKTAPPGQQPGKADVPANNPAQKQDQGGSSTNK